MSIVDCVLIDYVFAVRNLNGVEKALLPEIKPFSTNFLTSQVHKIIYGKPVQEGPEWDGIKSLIETCELVRF